MAPRFPSRDYGEGRAAIWARQQDADLIKAASERLRSGGEAYPQKKNVNGEVREVAASVEAALDVK